MIKVDELIDSKMKVEYCNKKCNCYDVVIIIGMICLLVGGFLTGYGVCEMKHKTNNEIKCK